MFIKESTSLDKLRSLKNNREVRLKAKTSRSDGGSERLAMMHQVWQNAMGALKEARNDGVEYLIIRHDKAPFKRGKVSVASQVRNLMRSHAAAPYIFRSKSIQLESAAIIAIRPKDSN